MDILLVEDSPGDVRLTLEAFAEASVPSTIHVVGDGVDALAYLRGDDPSRKQPRPDLILLDLNLPRMGGREVLAEIKSDPELKRIPVVVLTASKAEEDIHGVYDLHANCYIRKPVDFDVFMAMARSINHFWFAIVTPPT